MVCLPRLQWRLLWGFQAITLQVTLEKLKTKVGEITLSGSPLRMPEADLEWRLSFQISQNRNKLNEISNELKNLNARNNMEMEIPG